MRQNPAPSTRAALNSSSGSEAKKLRKSSVRIGMPKMVWTMTMPGQRAEQPDAAQREDDQG